MTARSTEVGVVRLTDAAAGNLEVENSHGCGGRGIPSLHGGGPEGAQGRTANQVTLNVKEIGDGTVEGDEALGLALGFKALHLPLSSSHSEMRILSTVVLS